MQGHRGLAGARPTGDLGDPTGWRPDRLVLLALDGGEDVAHGRAPGPGHAGQQRALTDHPDVLRHVGGDQQVVIDVHNGLTGAADHPSADHPHGFVRGGLVERRGGRRAPVHHQRVELGVADAQPPHVDGLAADQVEPPEHQPLGLGVQRLQQAAGVPHHHVPLEQHGRLFQHGLAGRPVAALVPLVPHGHGLGPQLGQPGVDPVDVDLLDRDLSLSDRGRRPGSWPGHRPGHRPARRRDCSGHGI